MDLLALIFPPNRMLLPGAEIHQNRFENHSPNITYSSSAGGGCRSKFPNLEAVDRPPGYEDVTFEPKTLVPPTYWTPEYANRQSIKSFASVKEEDVRDAIIHYASEQCCQYKDAIKYMKIKEINMLSTFRYTLETFTEKRKVVWCYEPYSGEADDLAKSGTPPGPWDITQTPNEQFKDGTWQAEIPYTASILQCGACEGSGKEKCCTCQGTNEVDSVWCDGMAKAQTEMNVLTCNGSGRERCTDCDSTGEIRCCTCLGKRKLKFYVKLITIWTNHKDEFVNQETPLPNELIREETEQVAFQEERSQVRPVDHFPQNSVKEASKSLINEHNKAFPMERILLQRHEVRISPIAQIKYTWNGGVGEFYVYGHGNKVYFPDYPQPYCCSCVVM